MSTKFWRQGTPTSRPVDQATIDRAQAATFQQAGPAMQHRMSQLPHDSDAYRAMQWAVKGAQEDLAARPGVVQRSTDPMANPGLSRLPSDGAPSRYYAPAAASAMDLDRAAVAKLDPSLSRFWDPPEVRQQRAAEHRQQSQSRIDSQTPLYRGMAGVGLGSVNGKEELYPVAGHVGEYSAAMGAVGLSGQTGASRQAYEQGRSNLVRGQERGRRGEKFEARKAGDLAFERQKELAGIKVSGGYGGKKGDTVAESGLKRSQATYWQNRSDWVKSTRQANEVNARLRVLLSRPGVDPNLDTIKVGQQEMTLAEAQAGVEQVLSDPGPQREDYDFGAASPPPGAAPAPAKPGFLERVGGMFRGGGQPAPAAQPTGAPPQNRQQARNAYISSLDPSLWESLDHNEREQFLASQGL